MYIVGGGGWLISGICNVCPFRLPSRFPKKLITNGSRGTEGDDGMLPDLGKGGEYLFQLGIATKSL